MSPKMPVAPADPLRPESGVSDTAQSIVIHISRVISANALWCQPQGFRRRIRSRAYRVWIEKVGWQLRTQLIGVPTIIGTFNAAIEIPETTPLDHDNVVKPILDLLQSVRAIRNDSGLRTLTVVGADRADVLVVLTDCGGPAQREPKVYRAKPVRSKRATTAQIARFEKGRARRML